MIVKISLVTCILSITCSKNANGASFSKVYVESDIVPVEYYQYGAPPPISGAQFSRIAAIPEETVVPLTSVPGLVSPCGTPCLIPSQAVPSTNILTYRTSVPNVPVVVAPTRNEAPGYEYSYVVYDDSTGDHKSQREQSDGAVVRGEYSFIQPDGYVREVQYVADDVKGFNAVVKNFLPTKVEGKKVEIVEKKEKVIPCHEIKHESLKKGSSEEESGNKISHHHEKKHKKDSKESSEESEENSKESSYESKESHGSSESKQEESKEAHKNENNNKSSEESVEISKEKHEPKNKDKKESNEKSVEKSKEKHSGKSSEESEEKQNKNHSKELSEESDEDHLKKESKGDSSEESLEIKAKPNKDEITEKSEESSGESHIKHNDNSSKESHDKSEESHKSIKESSEESEEHKKLEHGSEEQSEEKPKKKHKSSKKGCNEESGEAKKKSKEEALEASVEKLEEEFEEIKTEVELVTHPEHKDHELEPIVPHNDIVRCIQEAIERSNEKPGHQSDEPSPLTYIILNKPC